MPILNGLMGILLGLLNIFQEREETFSNIIQSRRAEREAKRKITYFLKSEEERQRRLREEEVARKLELSYFTMLCVVFASIHFVDRVIFKDLNA